MRSRTARLIDSGSNADQETIIKIFGAAAVGERPEIYKRIEGHAWSGDFNRKLGSRDKLYKVMDGKRVDPLENSIKGFKRSGGDGPVLHRFPWGRPAAAILAAALAAAACGMSSPKGFLGVKWGNETAEVARRLGVGCANWEVWREGSGFEICTDDAHPVDAFGRKAYVRMFRSQNQNLLEGLALEFRDCATNRDELTAAVRKALKLSQGEGSPYDVYRDGAAVRFDFNEPDGTCLLTVAGPRFGKAFAAYVLAEGMKNLSSGLRAR